MIVKNVPKRLAGPGFGYYIGLRIRLTSNPEKNENYFIALCIDDCISFL